MMESGAGMMTPDPGVSEQEINALSISDPALTSARR
jgi:hypothetical protein